MALSHVSKLYAVDSCKIAKMLTDPAGGSATYATGIVVPGIKKMEISGTVDSKQLRGDHQLLDSNAVLTDLSIAVDQAKLNLDELAVILGGTETDAGTTPNQTSSFDLLGTDRMSYFKIEARTPVGGADVPAGDVHFTLWKCILSAAPAIGFAEDDYRIISFTAMAVPRIADQKWLNAVYNETAAAIS